ncbi:hypothetical protein HanRHA438_Chr01g0002541 [Helianthus annuus]|nr:hypothetical protein HanRHA438_Chr01g0002541 [Helianthus annuus]
MNLSDYESDHRNTVETVFHWEGPMDERGRMVEKVPWWAREEARERAKMLRADPPKTRSQMVYIPFIILLNQCHSFGLSHDHLLLVCNYIYGDNFRLQR